MEFKVGMKVVCIGEFPIAMCNALGVDHPKKDQIYTISSMENLRSLSSNKLSLCLRFKELTLRSHGYGAEWFRPLDESFADEVLANITEQIEQEELVLV